MEYRRIISKHPDFIPIIPSELALMMLTDDSDKNKLGFDFIATYSSLEHSGLGRYGDPLDPYGDLEAAAQAWCALKPGGVLFLGTDLSSISQRLANYLLLAV